MMGSVKFFLRTENVHANTSWISNIVSLFFGNVTFGHVTCICDYPQKTCICD